MKILQLCDRTHEFVRGFDLIEEIARALVGEHKFVFGVLTGEPDIGLQQRIGCDIKLFNLDKKALKPTNIMTILTLVRYIRANNIDVVITHRFKPWLLMAVASLFLGDIKFVSVFHAFKQFDRKRRQWLARFFLDKKWRLVAVSDAVKGDLVAHKIPAGLIVVIRNAIDVSGVRAAQLPRSQARQYLGLPLDAKVVGTIGRTKPIKGQKYLIDAFAQLWQDRPDLWLIIIGGGEGEQALRNQAVNLGVAERTIITGPVPDASRLLKALDVFVLPSLSEGLGLALLEAMAANLLAIGTRVGGIPEALGSEGVLVARANAQLLAAAIDDMLSWSVHQREVYLQKLDRHLMTEFDVAQYHQRYRELIRELANDCSS